MRTIILLSLLLGGCASETSQWSVAESPKDIKVGRSHQSYFINASKEITDHELSLFSSFLGGYSTQGASFSLQAQGQVSPKSFNKIKVLLQRLGVPSHKILILEEEKRSPSGVQVFLTLHHIKVPKCADWSMSYGGAEGQNEMRSFGCANQRNFAEMVADPADLVAPEPLGSSDGRVSAQAVHAYRTGETPSGTEEKGQNLGEGLQGGVQEALKGLTGVISK